MSLVIAYAHVRIAQAWIEINGKLTDTPSAHLARAAHWLGPFDAAELDAPALAAVECILRDAAGSDDAGEAYRRLIALHPLSPNHIRAYGAYLAKRPERVDHEAAWLSQVTGEIWGEGGYTWLHFDPLSDKPKRLALLETGRFIQGVHDILDRSPDQHIVNELAAFCAISMRPGQDLSEDAEDARTRIHDCLDRILSRHLHELHPRLWAGVDLPQSHAQSKTGYRAMVAQGRKRALRSIADFLADQMADGCSIAFSPAGMYRLPAI